MKTIEVKETICYKTSDGMIFESQDVALKHEKLITFIKTIDEFVSSKDLYHSLQMDIMNFIVENREDLYNQLKSFFENANS